MANKKIIAKDGKYYLNKHQYFYVDKNKGKELLKEIKFPVLIMDTEFFNKSHDVENKETKIYSEADPDMIYTICYSIAKSFKDIDSRTNKEAISTLTVRRKNGQKFNFIEQRDEIMKKLFNVIVHKKIKTLIFAGESNDIKILLNWIETHKSLLNNKEVPLITKDKDGNLGINSFDMYRELTQAFSFVDLNEKGEEFYPIKNLQKGNKGENTIQIPSLEKFFDYVGKDAIDDDFSETRDIYDLCIDALKFYTDNQFTNKQFARLTKSIKMVKHHCHNDVLKLLYLTDFVYHFVCLDDQDNNFIKQDKEK